MTGWGVHLGIKRRSRPPGASWDQEAIPPARCVLGSRNSSTQSSGAGGVSISFSLGSARAFFDPSCDGLAAHVKGASQTTEARAFLLRVEDSLFFFWTIGVASWVLAVLFVAGAALVTLSAVRGEATMPGASYGQETVLDEVVALTVWAG